MRKGRLNISDPLYIWEGSEFALSNLAARNGTWRARVVLALYKDWGHRVSELLCRHEDVSEDLPIDELLSDDVGVDAAMVCVFESAEKLKLAWQSLEPLVVGPHGACSSSGLGDGRYSAYGRREKGQLTAVRIVYIPDALGQYPKVFSPKRRLRLMQRARKKRAR